MKTLLKILTLFLLVIGITLGALWWLWDMEAKLEMYGKPDIHLLVAGVFYHDYEKVTWEEEQIFDGGYSYYLPKSIWQTQDSLEQLPVEWVINPAEFEKVDSVSYGIKNVSGTKFYYISWGEPNSRIRIDYFIFRGNSIDTLLFDGHGCSTGIFLQPLQNGENAIGTQINPLLFNPRNGYELNLESDSFPNEFKDIYGDSVGIRFRLPTYSLPWSVFKSQMIESETFVVSTDKVILDWKKRR